jgi:phage shock protein A
MGARLESAYNDIVAAQEIVSERAPGLLDSALSLARQAREAVADGDGDDARMIREEIADLESSVKSAKRAVRSAAIIADLALARICLTLLRGGGRIPADGPEGEEAWRE